MFAKNNRANSREIDIVLKKNTRTFSEYFKLLTLPSLQLRCSVVISKKVLKRRVDRNRQKRRILHIVKEIIPLESSRYCIIWVQKDTSELNYYELKQNIHKILNQANIL